ncbi:MULTISPECIES: hypothetical protein [unclassified Rhizobium]|nr:MULTISPECIES: hypothetical protein [unclassified Rhizobium]
MANLANIPASSFGFSRDLQPLDFVDLDPWDKPRDEVERGEAAVK